jgi:hypothetical protein
MTSPSATQDRYPYQNEPIWSRSEKTVARAAFDAALKRELQQVMQEAKQIAIQIRDVTVIGITHLCAHAQHITSAASQGNCRNIPISPIDPGFGRTNGAHW